MGNTQSPPVNPRFPSASRAFTQKEIGDLRALFVSMAAQSQSNGRYISPSVFQVRFKSQSTCSGHISNHSISSL
ncbi:hypothetical protein SLA2020_255210 [Shorea laevis]